MPTRCSHQAWRARMARALRPIWPVAPVTTMRAGKGCSHVEGFRFRAAGAQADGRAQREGRAGAFGHAGDGVDAQCADEMVVLRGDQQEGAVGREGDVARRAPAGGEVAQRLQPGRIASQAEGGDAVVAAVGDHQQPAVRVQPERRGNWRRSSRAAACWRAPARGAGSRILGLPVDAERIGQLIDRDDQRAGQDQMARPRAGPRTQRPVGLRRQAVGLHAMADDRVGAQVAQVHMRAGGIGHREMRVRAVLAVGARPRALAPEGLRLAGGQALVVQRVAQQFARAVVRDVQLARHRIHADVAGVGARHGGAADESQARAAVLDGADVQRRVAAAFADAVEPVAPCAQVGRIDRAGQDLAFAERGGFAVEFQQVYAQAASLHMGQDFRIGAYRQQAAARRGGMLGFMHVRTSSLRLSRPPAPARRP